MIVKVQASLFDSREERQVLVYDESGAYMYQGKLSPAVERALRGRPKAFFHAEVRDGVIVLKPEEEAPWQSW